MQSVRIVFVCTRLGVGRRLCCGTTVVHRVALCLEERLLLTMAVDEAAILAELRTLITPASVDGERAAHQLLSL
eukprot:COSAG02_NODE_275_length_26232_cov_85.210424_16_plen_74_part_00